MGTKQNYPQQHHSLSGKWLIAGNNEVSANSAFLLKKLNHRFSVRLSAHRLNMLVNQWQHNRRTRKQLAEMPDYLLKDVGLDRSIVEQEILKPFWED